MNEKIYYNEDLPQGVEPLYNRNIADVYYSAHDNAHFRLSYDGLINFADPINDARDIDNGIINRLVFVNEQNIQSMLAEQGAFDSNKLNFGIESQDRER